MNIPNDIKELIKGYPLIKDDVGRSEDIVYLVGNKYILKISKNHQRLLKEKQINDYLKDKIPVAESVAYKEDNEYAYYLRTYIDGESLISKKYLNNPDILILLLKKANELIHSIDVENCPFKNKESDGNTFIHGDLCLPNILVKNDKIVGFIDLDSAGVGDVWMDYAWCIWSFEYNLNSKGYTPKLLEELGIEFNQELFDKYTKMGD